MYDNHETRALLVVLASALLPACASHDASPDPMPVRSSAPVTVVTSSEVDWRWLNPARGSRSPSAGTLWGDRDGTGPTGFLLRPVDGFESPPHIHNVTYRGVVLSGLIHNDDPQAGRLWMPAGSFWTQPKGHTHITAAQGGDTLAYIEIDAGPYLVQPPDEAFEAGEKPVNVHASNVVWSDLPGTWATAGRPRVAHLWGDPDDDRPSGNLLALPAGFAGTLAADEGALRAVVIDGHLRRSDAEATAGRELEPGSYFGSAEPSTQRIEAETRVVLYLRVAGRFGLTGR